MPSMSPPIEPDERRVALLQAAIGVFFRYGLHKTSMDDVARAAGISRQGLYRHFSSKEELFGETVRFVVNDALHAAIAALDDDNATLPARLEAAVLAWSGLHFSHLSTSAHVAEILAAAAGPLGNTVEDARRRFADAIARALRQSGVAETAKDAKERALTLEAAATGLKHSTTDVARFLRDLRVCIRVVLGDGGST
jgi:AcrR family transcriptional regulator